MCYGLGCEHEDRYTGECGFNGPGYFPCHKVDEYEPESSAAEEEGEEQ